MFKTRQQTRLARIAQHRCKPLHQNTAQRQPHRRGHLLLRRLGKLPTCQHSQIVVMMPVVIRPVVVVVVIIYAVRVRMSRAAVHHAAMFQRDMSDGEDPAEQGECGEVAEG